MKNTISLLLITVGICLTAGFGATLSPDFRAATIIEAEATFSDHRVARRQSELCEVQEALKLPSADGCGDSHQLRDWGGLTKIALRQAQILALAEDKRVLISEVAQARIMLGLALKRSQARWTAHEAMGTQGPGARLDGWLSVGGFGFGFGLLILALGGWLARKSAAQTVVSDDEEAPVDFGEMLSEVCGAVAQLHDDMVSTQTPNVGDLEVFKARLEDIQKEALARLCASGPRVAARHGLAGMAAVFSPLSSGERRLNRAWAAMVDRHWPEAVSSVLGASSDLKATVTALALLAKV